MLALERSTACAVALKAYRYAVESCAGGACFRTLDRRGSDHYTGSAPLPDILIYRSEAADPRQVDLLVAKPAFEEQVIARAERVAIGPCDIPVASPGLACYAPLAYGARRSDCGDAGVHDAQVVSA